MTDNTQNNPLSKPPEGVLTGDTVPRENEAEGKDEQVIQEVIGRLKSQGKPWSLMSDSEIRKRVKDHLVNNGEIQ